MEKEAWIKVWWGIDILSPKSSSARMSVKEEESEVVLGTARHSLRSLIMTYSLILIAVMLVHIDRW